MHNIRIGLGFGDVLAVVFVKQLVQRTNYTSAIMFNIRHNQLNFVWHAEQRECDVNCSAYRSANYLNFVQLGRARTHEVALITYLHAFCSCLCLCCFVVFKKPIYGHTLALC